MPIARTRKEMAAELFAAASRGPAFETEDARRAYRLWSTSSLLPDLCRLIPELKGQAVPKITQKPDAFWDRYPGDPHSTSWALHIVKLLANTPPDEWRSKSEIHASLEQFRSESTSEAA